MRKILAWCLATLCLAALSPADAGSLKAVSGVSGGSLGNAPANSFLGGPCGGASGPSSFRTLCLGDVPVQPDTNISLSTPLLNQTYQSGLNQQFAASIFTLVPTACQSSITSGVGTYTWSLPTFVCINANAAARQTQIAGSILQLTGADSTQSYLDMDTFASAGSLTFRRADGTGASPSAVQLGEVLGQVSARGYGATGYGGASRANLQFLAGQNWTDSAQGAGVTFNTTPNGGVSTAEAARFAPSGDLLIGLTTDNSKYQLNVNNNATANAWVPGYTSTASSGITVAMTSTSSEQQTLTGSSAQQNNLPDATTLALGWPYRFNNNSSQTWTIANNGGTSQYAIPAGGFVNAYASGIGTANGVWDFHPLPPATVTWGSGTTGFVMNTALTTSPSVSAGASSCTAPSFMPQRGSSTTGLGGDGSSVCGAVSGVQTFQSTASKFIVNNEFSITGSLSAANPQLNGFGMDGSPTPTYTDSTATGTTTNEALYAFPQATLTSTSTATFTNVYDLYVPNPAACINTGVSTTTCTSRFSIGTGGGIRVGTGGITIAGGGLFVTGGSTMNGSVTFGTNTALTLSSGEIGMIKIAASGTAPGAAGAKLAFVCGTAAGSVKLISYAGTSTTPSTVLDNIGSGVTGC